MIEEMEKFRMSVEMKRRAIVAFLLLRETECLSLSEIADHDFGQILDHKAGVDGVQGQDSGR